MERDESLAHFIKYNNAVPITLGVLFLLTTGAAAASPEVRDAVYSTSSVAVTQDTSYLESANLEKYPFSMRVTGVAEDDEYYYISYEFLTIEPIDAVWKSSTRKDVLRVSKALLHGGDLKAYVESEFAQVRWHEIDSLTKLQDEVRRSGGTQKVVVTSHSGLVGSLLKPTEEQVPQYHPEVSSDDPLYVDNPRPLVTWDENKQEGEAPRATSGGVIHTTATIIIDSDGTVSTSTEQGSTTPSIESPQDNPEPGTPAPESDTNSSSDSTEAPSL